MDHDQCDEAKTVRDLRPMIVNEPLTDMANLVLDLAAAIEDPCGEDEIHLARSVIDLLLRTPRENRVFLAEILAWLNFGN